MTGTAAVVPKKPVLKKMSAAKKNSRAESRRLHALFSGSITRRTMRVKRKDRVRRNIKLAKAAGKKIQPKAAQKQRWNFVPGTVLIILAGRYRGSRVVFLRELPSKLLLVSGPMRVNGVPLRRVNRAYVAKTSTIAPVSEATLALAAKVEDKMFKKPKKAHASKIARAAKREGSGAFFDDKKKKSAKNISKKLKTLQYKIDMGIVRNLVQVPYLRGYLATQFTLTKGVFPHMVNF